MTPLTSAQSELAAKYVPLAKRMARRLPHVLPRERLDFRSAAFLGLCEAARAFDPAVGVDFSTYARRRIDGAMRTYQAANPNGLNAADADNAVAPENLDAARFDDRDQVLDLIRRLPQRHRHLCRLLYLDGMDRREAARVMGLSKSRVSRLHDEAFGLLKAS